MVSRLVNPTEQIQTFSLHGKHHLTTTDHNIFKINISSCLFCSNFLTTIENVLAGPESPLIDIFVLLTSVIYCLSISLRYLQSVHTVTLGVTKQIVRPTEFFPLTITETITDKSTQISIWLNIYFPVITDSPGLVSAESCKQIVIVLIQCSPLHTWAGWLGVGGWGQIRPDQIPDSSHILQIYDPISSSELQQP